MEPDAKAVTIHPASGEHPANGLSHMKLSWPVTIHLFQRLLWTNSPSYLSSYLTRNGSTYRHVRLEMCTLVVQEVGIWTIGFYNGSSTLWMTSHKWLFKDPGSTAVSEYVLQVCFLQVCAARAFVLYCLWPYCYFSVVYKGWLWSWNFQGKSNKISKLPMSKISNVIQRISCLFWLKNWSKDMYIFSCV